VGLFLVIDALAWMVTYRAATAPSPEELRRTAGATPVVGPSIVEERNDGLYEEVSLNGEWRYRQAGSELAPPSPSQELVLSGAKGEGRGEGVTTYFSLDLDASAWRTMAIPQNWYLAGLNYHGVIWFRRAFEVDEAWRGRVVRLRFDGVDYLADVWLNGEHLGHHEGYFQPFFFDVTERLNYGGRNVLAVRVESPYEEFRTVWHHHKTLIKGTFAHHDTRPGGGWGKAGQEYNTGGIWNDVSLLVSDFLTVEAVRLQATWPTTVTVGTDAAQGERPAVNAYISLRNHADTSIEAEVILRLSPRNFEGEETGLPPQTVTLARGKTEVELNGVVQNPRLWWPWDHGEPNLYTAKVTVATDGKTIAKRETTFGFRQILVGEDWSWTLNGQRFFPRGSNYISTQWLSETDREWFLRDVGMMRDANLNFVRVHAHVEPVEFYEAADEAGMLVWQDFPLQRGYTDAPAFVDEAQRQMRDMVELLANHPSIVVWCAHNESPWDAPWMADRVPDYDPRQNKRLDELLYEQARELDPTRYVHLNSGTGDEHVYLGWYTGDWWQFADLPGAPFVTEYGAQALPNLDTMARMFAPLELVYDSGEVAKRWEFHDFQSHETFDIAGVERGESIEEFIADSQAYQANLVQFATEAYRRAKYDPMQGIFHFMFVENWPSITWAVVDYYRRPKVGYYALQTAMQPILPSIAPSRPARLERDRWIYVGEADFYALLWVVNDALAEYPAARLSWRVVSEAGETVKDGVVSVDIPSDSASGVALVRHLDLAPGAYDLRVELLDAQGRELGSNRLAFAIEPPVEEAEG